MRRRGTGTALGLALMIASGSLGGAGGDMAGAVEPVARALVPLGPVRALVSSGLWLAMLRSSRNDDTERLIAVAHALLEVHPDLVKVREFLAWRLITAARRAPDRRRHEALLAEGLWVLEDALSQGDNPAVHRALGRLLADNVRLELDPRLAAVVEDRFGDTPEDLAIEHLRWTWKMPPDDAFTADLASLAGLLARRGEHVLDADGDSYSARRLLAEAQRAVTRIRELDDPADWDPQGLVDPLRERLREMEGEQE